MKLIATNGFFKKAIAVKDPQLIRRELDGIRQSIHAARAKLNDAQEGTQDRGKWHFYLQDLISRKMHLEDRLDRIEGRDPLGGPAE